MYKKDMQINEKHRQPSPKRLLQIGLSIIIWGVAAFAQTGCSRTQVKTDAVQFTSVSQNEESENEESTAAEQNENGGNDMTREFVEVALVAEDHFMLENTKGEFYWIDIKYNENYEEGDLLCLIYKDKVRLMDDCWKVEPKELYVNDNRVDIPQF